MQEGWCRHVKCVNRRMMESFAKQLLPCIRLLYSLKCGIWYDNNYLLTNVALLLPVYSEQVDIDLIGPLPTTSRGNRFIVTLVDYFSKWPEAEAIPNKSAKSVAHSLYKMMCQ